MNTPHELNQSAWQYLEAKNYQSAKEHFAKVLQIDPNFSDAQEGLGRIIKKENFIYRLLFTLSTWFDKIPGGVKNGILIFGFMVLKVEKFLPESWIWITKYLEVTIYILIILIFLSSFIEPLINLTLRLSKYGQLVLSREEKISSTLIGIFFTIGIVTLLLGLIFKNNHCLAISFWAIPMVLPTYIMFVKTKVKNLFLYITIGLGILGLLYVGDSILKNELINVYLAYYLFFIMTLHIYIVGRLENKYG